MSLQACIDIVRKGDPDRFQAIMAAPVEMRARLWPLFAFNVEVARAPWASPEPMVAEMRVQWWADVLDEITNGDVVRRHEVTDELAPLLTPDMAQLLTPLVEARRRDCYGEDFSDQGELLEYLSDTNGRLMVVAARCVGGRPDMDAVFGDIGKAAGLANWYRAVPELTARGRKPLVDDSAQKISTMATRAMEDLNRARPKVPKSLRPVSRISWEAARTLHSAASNPAAVVDGLLHRPEISRRFGLLWRVLVNAP